MSKKEPRLVRAIVDYEGIGFRASTWKAHSSLISEVALNGREAVIGKGVTIRGDGVAGFAEASTGAPLLGRVHQYEFGLYGDPNEAYITVQDGGYASFPTVSGSGAPSAGDFVAVNHEGNIRTVSDGEPATGARCVISDTGDGNCMVLIG